MDTHEEVWRRPGPAPDVGEVGASGEDHVRSGVAALVGAVLATQGPTGGALEAEKLGEVTCYDRTPADKVRERIGDAAAAIANKVLFDADINKDIDKI